MVICEAVIRGGVVVSTKGDDYDTDGFKVWSFITELPSHTHEELVGAMDYYDLINDKALWSHSETDWEDEEDCQYAKITIDGETRYYEI